MEDLCCLATQGGPKKHPCPDCRFCQHCSDSRCRSCRGHGKRKHLGISEQIAMFDALNRGDFPKPFQPMFLTDVHKDPGD